MSDYPITIDALLDPDYSLGLGASNPTHPEQHTLFKEILAALEAKVGTNNSPDPTSIDSLLKNTTVGHHHDGIDSRAVAVGGGAHPDLATHDALGLATDAELAAHAGAADPHTGYQKESEKGAVNGYAGLDGSGTVPDAQLPAGLARDTEVSAAVTAHEAAGDPHAGYELEAAHTKAAHDALALSHDSLADVSNDDHHPKSHGHTGADGSGTVAHSVTTGQTANDHHNESHAARHADGGADEVVDAGQSVSTQAFGDAASVGADTAKAAPVLHKHAMPANPVTAHEAAADPHTGYVLESLADAKGDLLTATADNTPARLAVGADFSEELVPDSSAITGLRWGIRRSALRPSGALYETAARMAQNNQAIGLTSQTLRLVAIELPNGVLISSVTFVSGATPLASGNHQLFGLFDDDTGASSGTARALLRGSVDDTNTAWGANSPKTLSLTSTYTTTRGGWFFLGVLVDAGTPNNLAGYAVMSGIAGLTPVSGASSTGQTSLPNPAAAITASTNTPYAFVS